MRNVAENENISEKKNSIWSMLNAAERRVVVICTAVFAVLGLTFGILYSLDARPCQRLAQRWADTLAPVDYVYRYQTGREKLDESGELVKDTKEVIVSSRRFMYEGVDTVTGIDEIAYDIATLEDGTYTLTRLDEEYQKDGAAEKNSRTKTWLQLIPWLVKVALALAIAAICTAAYLRETKDARMAEKAKRSAESKKKKKPAQRVYKH